jgi:hypothetical protein
MRLRAFVAAVPVWLAATGLGLAQDENYVDLELVLAVDISRSMDFDEQEVQRQGYVDAFRHRDVIDAITTGAAGRIAVTYLEWAGIGLPQVMVPWTVVDGAETAAAFADAMAAVPLTRLRGTSISSGLQFASAQFDRNDYVGERQVIDISGDGPNNMGVPVVPVRDAIVDRGITINGLPVMIRPSPAFGTYNIPNLDVYYEDCVIGGPGSFVVTVEEPSQFAVAIRRKLVLEIASRDLPVVPVAMRGEPRIDCLIGEKLRRMWFSP